MLKLSTTDIWARQFFVMGSGPLSQHPCPYPLKPPLTIKNIPRCHHTSWGRGSRVTHPWLRSTDFYKREMPGVLRIYNRETGPKLAKLSDN